MAMYIEGSGEYSYAIHAPASNMLDAIKRTMQTSRIIRLQLDGDELEVLTEALQSYAVKASLDKNSPGYNAGYQKGYNHATLEIRKALGIMEE